MRVILMMWLLQKKLQIIVEDNIINIFIKKRERYKLLSFFFKPNFGSIFLVEEAFLCPT